MRDRTFASRFQGLWVSFVLLEIWCITAPGLAHAQSVSLPDEYRKLITAGQSVTPLGSHPFGESVNLYNGSLSFEVTDVSIPGIGPTLSLSRSLDTASGRPLANIDRERPFGDWDLDIPRIETATAFQANVTGWFVASYGNAGYLNRCTDFVAPPPVNSSQGAPPWSSDQWWQGYNLVLPGEGSQTLLAGGSLVAPQPANGTWPIDTKSNWRIGCGVMADGTGNGEGFIALAPDGTRYTFAHLVYRPMVGLTKPLDEGPDAVQANSVHPLVATSDILSRREGLMYVTQVEDRFGNTLTYNWSSNDPDGPVNNHLNSIVASDGRELDLTYVSGTPLIHTITEVAANGAPTRVWTYSYDTSGVEPSLIKVQLPDDSQAHPDAWIYGLSAFQTAPLVTQVEGTCTNGSSVIAIENGGTPIGSITAPSGLTATFKLQSMVHGRSGVPLECRVFTDDPAGFPKIPDEYAQYSLIEEDLSGPGLPAGNPANDCQSGAAYCLKYGYSTLNPSWQSGTGNCSATVYTDVTDPLHQDVVYTYSNCFDASEGKLLRTNAYSGAAGPTPLRSVVSTYANPTGGPWPTTFGQALQPYLNHAQISEISPLKTTVITQDGAIFSTDVNTFDDLARVTSTSKFSSLGYSKTDVTSYADDTTHWVLGLITQTATGKTIVSQTNYNNLDQPTSQCSFGRLVSTSAWNTDGTLASMSEGGPTVTSCGSTFPDGRTTAFSNWYRGVPEQILYADGSKQSATVNGDGWVTSVTDENGNTTNYAYDAMGHLTEIVYPTGPDDNWNDTSLSFAPISGSELGIPGGHWKQVVQTGNAYAVTYFDAYWRPLVTERYDAGNTGATSSQTVTGYDADGRTVFTSNPTRGATSYTQSIPGIHTTYDALNRVTEVDQDSSLGLLPTTTQYLSNFRTSVIKPNQQDTGVSTVTSYEAFGTPTTQWPVSIAAPAGEVTTIARDVFGNPLSITRNATSCGASSSVCRKFAYNAYLQLCGRTEPETGTTMFGYDGAGNLLWSVPGLPATSGCYTFGQAQDSGHMISRTYDARNRLTSITYPDTFSNTIYSYALDGALLSQNVFNDDFPVTTSYSYDKRRLLTSETLCFSAPPCPSNAQDFVLTYHYDLNGHVDTITYPDGRSLGYVPNALGQPTQAGSYATGVTYYPNGAIAGFSYGNGVVHAMTENMRGLVERSTDDLNSTHQMDFAYAYDGDGNVKAISDGVSSTGNVDMVYDALDRLKEADSLMFGGTTANPGKALYGYDVFNNLTSASVGNLSSFDYGYNTQNQLAKLIDPSSGTSLVTYAYDVQGNLAQKNSQIYKFDMANRLESVPGLATYRYDAAGRRVQKVETESGKTLDSDYSRAGNLMYQWDPATANSTDYIHLGSTLVARVVGNNSELIGNVDGVTSGDNAAVYGWACSTGSTTPVSVEVFVGNTPQQGGTSIATVTANQPSNSTVASACRTQGTNYGFSVPLTSAVRSQYPDEPIIVFALSPSGGANVELTGSGQYTVPTNPAAPAAPASISVPATSTGSFTVSWTASDNATEYVLERFNDDLPDGSWTKVYTGSATSFDESGLGDAVYTYHVQACNSTGCSTFTTSSSVVVAPAPPASISVPASSYSSSFGVSWSASAGAADYALQESANGGAWTNEDSVAATSTTVTVAATGSYRFRVAACAGLTCSIYTVSSNVAVTLAPTNAPSLSGPASSANGTYALSWTTVVDATSYRLNQNINGTLTTPYSGGGTTWSSSNLGNGTYNYQAFACNVAGCSPGSANISVVVTHPPASAPSLSGPSSSSTGTYTLTWSTVSTATRYQLNQSANGGTASKVYNSTGTSWSSNAVGNGSYAYVVYACNVGGCSPASSTVTVTVLHPPAAPTLSGPSSSASGTFKLTWTSAATATSYHLHQSVNGGASSLIYVTAGNSWSSSNLGNGSYAYSVCADNAAGCGPSSNTVTVSVLHVPAVPTYMTAPSSVPYPGNPWSISIAASSGATSYNLRRTDTATGAATVKSDVGTSTTDYTTPGTYQYAAQACNASGCSGWRNAGNTTNVFCAESATTMTRGTVSPAILKCGGTL